MLKKTKEISNVLEENRSEEFMDAYINSLFDAKDGNGLLVEDSVYNKRVLRDFIYDRISENKFLMMCHSRRMKQEEYDDPEDKKELKDLETKYEEEKKYIQKILDKMQEAADKHGVKWVREFIEAEKNSPFYQMNLALSDNNITCDSWHNSSKVVFLEGKSLRKDLYAIKMYQEWPHFGGTTDKKGYLSHVGECDEMRAKLFDMIADGKVKYPLEELKEFYFGTVDERRLSFDFGDEDGDLSCYGWGDKTNIIGNEAKYPGYLRGMNAIKERIINEVGLENLTDGQISILLDQSNNEGELIEKLKKAQNSGDKTVEGNMSDKFLEASLEAVSAGRKLADVKQKLAKTMDDLTKAQQDMVNQQMNRKEQEEAFLVGSGFVHLSTDKRRELFERGKTLMTEYPVMQEVSLTTMCRCYVEEKDKKAKLEFLKTLYQIRKGGETRQEKNEMADTFARVLDKTPELKKDENLVALSKRDTVVSQPTRQVRRQVESAGK